LHIQKNGKEFFILAVKCYLVKVSIAICIPSLKAYSNIAASCKTISSALAATLGIVLPSFLIILLIAALIRNLLKFKGTQAFLSGVRPCVVGLIFATAITLFLSNILGIKTLHTQTGIDFKGLIIFVLLFAIAFFVKKLLHKKPSPILMILISAGLGAVLYAF
jgi:chromate transporter